MKLKKIKYWLPITLLSAITLPIALTSCSTVSQYIMPITIGNGLIDNGPFSNVSNYLTNDTVPNTSQFQNQTSNFIFKTSTSGEVTNYGLVTKNIKDNDSLIPLSPTWMDLQKQSQYSWVDSKDFTNPKPDGAKSFQYLSDWQNYNSYLQTSFITTIASNVEYMITYMMHLLLSSHNLNNLTNLQTVYDQLDSSLLNDDFFEFACAYANLLNEGNTGVRFGISNINFNLQGNNYLDTNFLGPLALGNNLQSDDPYRNINGMPNDQKYGIFYTNEEQTQQNKKATDIKAYRPVCFLIDNLKIDYNFYNSKNNLSSIFYDDWAIKNQQKVQDVIKDHWNGITNNSGNHPFVTTLNWQTNLNAKTDPIDKDQIPTIIDPEGNTNGLLQNAKSNSLIVVANFVPGKVYYENNNHETSEDQYYYMPQFSSLSGIYPAFMLNDPKAWIDDPNSDLNGWINTTYLSDTLKNNLDFIAKNDQTFNSIQQKNPEVFSFIKHFFTNYISLDPNNNFFLNPIK